MIQILGCSRKITCSNMIKKGVYDGWCVCVDFVVMMMSVGVADVYRECGQNKK
jgi:hypothetical protein